MALSDDVTSRLEIDNARLEAAAKQQANQINAMQKGTHEATAVRMLTARQDTFTLQSFSVLATYMQSHSTQKLAQNPSWTLQSSL